MLVWGRPWGTAELRFGVPILMLVKAVCDRIDNLKPVGGLLAD